MMLSSIVVMLPSTARIELLLNQFKTTVFLFLIVNISSGEFVLV